MTERLPLRERRRRRFTLAGWTAVAAATLAASACTESFEGGAACPALCPRTLVAFVDTTIEAVALDSAVGGFPTLGLSSTLLLANRPDTLVTTMVVRFDQLTSTYVPNRGTVSEQVTAIDSVFLKLPLDTTGRRGTVPVTVEVFDVDTAASDSVTAVVQSLFRPDRRLGQVTLTPSLSLDSLRIPLSRQRLAAQVASGGRFRVGVRISGGAGQLRVIGFLGGFGAPTLSYDPSTDTTYTPVVVSPSTPLAGASADLAQAYTVYGITQVGSAPPGAATLVVGGYPAYRSYLRFAVPTRIADSSTIVRAQLVLVQRPSRFGNTGDSVRLVPLVPSTTGAVTDLRRVLELSAEGVLAGLDGGIRLVPRDSGERLVNLLPLTRTWRTLPANVPRAVAFRIDGEGAQPAELRFHSIEAAAALRPRLRLTYLPRAEFALP